MHSKFYLFVILIILSSALNTLAWRSKVRKSEVTTELDSSQEVDSEYEEDNEYDPKVASVWKEDKAVSSYTSDVCTPAPLGGVAWLLSVRKGDFGWGADTHRAVIALATAGWPGVPKEDRRQMEMQLEVELTRDLMRNGTSTLYPNDLALYIHALIAIQRNPRNFHGLDLVARLEKLVDSTRDSHPFLLLSLCNARALDQQHSHRALASLQKAKLGINTEYLALALNAYECAGTLDHPIDDQLIEEVRKKLIDQQETDGSFGNVYKTSLVVLALASKSWGGKRSALDYLEKQSTKEVNMVSTYLMQIALNAEKLHFIKDLHPELTYGPPAARDRSDDPFIQYTLRREPDVYFTITVRVEPNMTFFDVMKLSAQHDSKFNFSYFYDRDEKPSVYSISGVPNDAEENLYWRLCLQTDMNHDRHQYTIRTIRDSPANLKPNSEEHVIYWYKNTDCETLNG